jgi:hypothetical protein
MSTARRRTAGRSGSRWRGARRGRLEQARTWFTRATATANDLGLLAEQVDPHNGELIGNFPQGLSHLAHLPAAVALHRATAVADRHRAIRQQPARQARAIRRLPPMERTA